jgi:hypothetical protein
MARKRGEVCTTGNWGDYLMGVAQKETKVTFDAALWCDRAKADFDAIPGSTADLVADYAEGLKRGTYQMLAVMVDKARVGSILFEVVQERSGPVVIIHALRCDAVAGLPVTEITHAKFVDNCRAQGAVLLRCFTERAGLVRRLCKLGAKAVWQIEVPL